MIDEVMDIIKDEADSFLKLKMKDSRQQYVQLVPVVDLGGKPSVSENAICMSLVRIEEDRVNRSGNREYKMSGDKAVYFNAPVKLNLYILFSAAYVDGQEKNYKEALKRLSYVISCFQAKHVFMASNTPRLDPAFGKLDMELYNMPMEEQNHFWGMFGGLYRPSVLYCLGALMVQEDHISGLAEPAREIEADTGGKYEV
jgi:hypothetical protein